jgi:hypothetical protein
MQALVVLVSLLGVTPVLFVEPHQSQEGESGTSSFRLSPAGLARQVAHMAVDRHSSKKQLEVRDQDQVSVIWSSLEVGRVAVRGHLIDGKCSLPKYSIWIPARRGHKRTLRLQANNKCEVVVMDLKESLAARSGRSRLTATSLNLPIGPNRTSLVRRPEFRTLLDRARKPRVLTVDWDWGYVEGEANFWSYQAGTIVSISNEMEFWYWPEFESSYVGWGNGSCINYSGSWSFCSDPAPGTPSDDPALYVTSGELSDGSFLALGVVGNYDGGSGCFYNYDIHNINIYAGSDHNCTDIH